MKTIDNFLNNITMYKLTLYGLLLTFLYSLILGFSGLLSYEGTGLLLSFITISATCFVSNKIFSKISKALTNSESWFITALILFFILMPLSFFSSFLECMAVVVVSAVAMLSKYIFVYSKKHIFNPAAIALVFSGLLSYFVADFAIAYWWVATAYLLPVIVILGFLIVRKIHRSREVISFFIFAIISILFFTFMNQGGVDFDILQILKQNIVSGPIIFFALFMLIEPLTTPPTRNLQIIYGAIVGILYGAQFNFGLLHSSPELALILGNIYAFIVSSKQRVILSLIDKKELTKDIFEFTFKQSEKLIFTAGQYLEWTLPHVNADSRGNRRYFTVASSPTEENLKLSIRVSENGSSFKKALLDMKNGDTISASSLAGDFTLPKSTDEKLLFIAGGIGITPFRSMIQYLCDRGEKRDIVLIYSCRDENSFVYDEIFEEAKYKINLKTIKITEPITKEMLEDEVGEFKGRDIYISGPGGMVEYCKTLLLSLRVSNSKIHTDYFPGF